MDVFAFGTFWFWALVVLEIVALLALIGQKNPIGGFVSFVAFVLLLQFLGNIDVFGFIVTNPLKTLALTVSYFILGTFWASLKWTLLVLDNVRKAKEYREQWLNQHDAKFEELTPEEESLFYHDLERYHPQPQISEHKSEFFMWMSFWWVSLVVTIFSDFFTRIFKEIYNAIHKWLQRISNSFWEKAGFRINKK